MKLFSYIFLFALLVAQPMQAADTNTNSAENRFLIVAEKSNQLRGSAKAIERKIQDLVETGMNGRLKKGDTLGLWIFNETLNTDFPMQEWMESNQKELATKVEKFYREKSPKKSKTPENVLSSILSVVRSSKSITVVTISSSSSGFQGTPFDDEINRIRNYYRRDLGAEYPLMTVLVGQNGKLVTFSVNALDSPAFFPQPPAPEQKLAAVPVKENFPAPSGTNDLPAKAPAPKLPRPNIILSKSNSVDRTNITASSAPLTAPKTNRIEIPLESSPEIKTNVITAEVAIKPPSAATPNAATQAITTLPSVQSTPADAFANSSNTSQNLIVTNSATNLARSEIPQKTNASMTEPRIIVSKGSPRRSMLAIAVVVGFLLVAVAFFLLKKSVDRRQSSFISRSMNRKK